MSAPRYSSAAAGRSEDYWLAHAELQRLIDALRDAGYLCTTAERFARRLGMRSVVLTGGCLQNRRLPDRVRSRPAAADLEVLVPRRLPPNDGGLAAGQAVVVVAREAWK